MHAHYTAALVVAALLGVPLDDPSVQRFQASQPHMGTAFEVVLYATDLPAAERAFQAAFARIAELDKLMSDYDPDSELSRLSKSAPTSSPVPISEHLTVVLDHAQRLSARTGGAFDVTVGPLTRLWRRARRQKRFPDATRLEQARTAVGYRDLVLDVDRRTARLLRPDMRLDLGGIAKGYAADSALEVLRQQGVTRALINAGGDISVSGAPPDQPGWRVGIAPLQPQAPPSRFVVLAHAAVATSGDAWQFVEIDGKRYSHIIDPHTGLGLTRRSSVTVIAPNGTQADCVASAVSVLGHQRGQELIEQTPQTAAFMVLVEGSEVRTYQSKRFQQFVP